MPWESALDSIGLAWSNSSNSLALRIATGTRETVAQVGNLLYPRLAVGRTSAVRGVCGLPIRDTADCQSAVPIRPSLRRSCWSADLQSALRGSRYHSVRRAPGVHLVAVDVSPLHLNSREVRADSRRLLRFKGSTREVFRGDLSPRQCCRVTVAATCPRFRLRRAGYSAGSAGAAFVDGSFSAGALVCPAGSWPMRPPLS